MRVPRFTSKTVKTAKIPLTKRHLLFVLPTALLLVFAYMPSTHWAHAKTANVFSTSDAPSILLNTDTNGTEVGEKFYATVNGQVTGMRFYKGGTTNGGTHYGHLWTASGTQLAQVQFTSETSSGWQDATFSSPVNVTADTTYVVSYYAPQGHYSSTSYGLDNGISSGYLHLVGASTSPNGVYVHSTNSTGAFPTSTYENSNYYVDVDFAPNTSNVFSTSDTPTIPLNTDTNGTEVGEKFYSTVSGSVTGIRFYKGGTTNGGTHYGHLWTMSGTQLAQVQFTSESSSGWQDATLSTPVNITANTKYIVSYYAPQGHYSSTSYGLSNPISNGYLNLVGASTSANGVYLHSTNSTGAFPTSTYQNSDYYVDVDFTPGQTNTVLSSDLATPSIPLNTDSNGTEVGQKFYADTSGEITGIRFYKGGTTNGGTHYGHLWTSSGTQLAQVQFTGESSSGWQNATLPTPVNVMAGTTYIVSYYAPQGHYSSTLHGLDNSYNNGYLHYVGASTSANGVYIHSTNSTGAFPTSTYQNSNYYVDIDFTPDQPSVTHVSGTLAASTEWTAGNVYVIDSTVDVPSGVTLTIDPGAIVKVASTVSGIQVDTGGTLTANGTPLTRIMFTSCKDDTSGGDSNGDNGSTTPSAGDYYSAITMNGGTANVSYANFKYAEYEINNAVYTNGSGVHGTGSSLTVSDSAFSDIAYQAVNQDDNATLSLQRNTFSIASGQDTQVLYISGDPDLSGVVLSGANENSFTGSGLPSTIQVATTPETIAAVPTGSTWEVSSDVGNVQLSMGTFNVAGTFNLDSGTKLITSDNGGGSGGAVQVEGTANLQSGVVVKSNQGTPFWVDTGGTLNATGTSASPDMFTSTNDNGAGDIVSGSSGSPAAGDYYSAVNMHGGTANIAYANVEYGTYGINNSVYTNQSGTQGAGSVLAVTDSSFSSNSAQSIDQIDNAMLSLERNTFNVGGRTGSTAVTVSGDPNLSGIALTGANENTFIGSGLPTIIQASSYSGSTSNVPSGSTWEVSQGSSAMQLELSQVDVVGTLNMDSGTELIGSDDNVNNNGAAKVDGTVNLSDGVTVKVTGGTSFIVNTGGTLNINGTSADPDTFTSANDNSISSAFTGSTGTPAANDYYAAIGINGGNVSADYANIDYANIGINMTTGGANFENSNSDNTSYAIQDTNGDTVYRGSITNTSHGIYACNWQFSCSVDAAYVNWGSVDGPYPASGALVCGQVLASPWSYGGSNYNAADVFETPACGSSENPADQLHDTTNSFQAEVNSLNLDCSNSYEDACNYISTFDTCYQNAWTVVQNDLGGSFTFPSGSPISDPWGYASGVLKNASDYIGSLEKGSESGMTTGAAGEAVSVVTTLSNLNGAYNSCLSTAHSAGY